MDTVHENAEQVIQSTLITAATTVIESIPVSKVHSVAAAVLSTDGQIYTGVSKCIYKFATH